MFLQKDVTVDFVKILGKASYIIPVIPLVEPTKQRVYGLNLLFVLPAHSAVSDLLFFPVVS